MRVGKVEGERSGRLQELGGRGVALGAMGKFKDNFQVSSQGAWMDGR